MTIPVRWLPVLLVGGGLFTACGLLAACGTPGRNVPVEIAQAPEPLPDRLVALEVGRLLTADPDVSRAAERRLTTLDEEGRRALGRHAASIPGETDPRWFHVLEENHALPPLPPEQDLEYLLWKVGHEESFYAVKAQGRLLDLARSRPDLLLSRLERGGRGTEAIAVALAMAGELDAVPPLLRRYRHARSPEERRVAAEALTWLAGEDQRPRVQGSERDIERDADGIERWYRERMRAGRRESSP